eukprot:COSAG02_NODE_4183_length_5655_cov_6.673326_1_plen_123_part_00
MLCQTAGRTGISILVRPKRRVGTRAAPTSSGDDTTTTSSSSSSCGSRLCILISSPSAPLTRRRRRRDVPSVDPPAPRRGPRAHRPAAAARRTGLARGLGGYIDIDIDIFGLIVNEYNVVTIA